MIAELQESKFNT